MGMIEASRRTTGWIKECLKMLDRISLILTIVGGINWLLVGLFQFDLVAYIGGGQAAMISRIIYTVVGIAALWCISLLFRERTPETGRE
jgi:uncharacterized membrane protein YuzA (DUF378 family)